MSDIRTRALRLTVASALAVAVLVGGLGPGTSGALTYPSPIYLGSSNSDMVVDVPGGLGVAGNPLIQWPAQIADNQQWNYINFGSIGGFDVVVFQSAATGMVIDVAGSSTADGALVVQNPWSGAPSQVWLVASLDDRHAALVNMGSGKVLDVAGASKDEGALLIQWPFNGGLNQMLSLFNLAVID